MNKIKKEITETFEKIKFLKGKDKQLVGYAEMFGNECIPLYNGINYLPCSSSEEAISKIYIANLKARKADGFDSCIIGHLKLDNGSIVLLYNKSSVIEQLKQEYLSDTSGLFDGEEDCETSAIENYEYNILGSYMDGIPAFAILYSM